MSDKRDIAFGQSLIRLGIAKPEQIRELYNKYSQTKGKGPDTSFDRYLIALRVVKPEEAKKVLAEIDDPTKTEVDQARQPRAGPTRASPPPKAALPPLPTLLMPKGQAPMPVPPETRKDTLVEKKTVVVPRAKPPTPPRPAPVEAPAEEEPIDADDVEAQSAAEFFSHPNYKPIKLLGKGGMGAVILAFHANLKRLVAVKVMLAEADEDRFKREAEVTARVEHPNIVSIHEIGRDKLGQPYLVLRFLDGGQTLADKIKKLHENFDCGQEKVLADWLRIFIQVCLAVDYAHQKGIVHRDLKPANVMVDKYGMAQVMDFGLAKVQGLPDIEMKRQAGQSDLPLTATQAVLTQVGEALGTPMYMAPEQAFGDNTAVDARSDVYGLGAVLYEMLTGVWPVEATDMIGMLKKVCMGEIIPPRIRTPEKKIPKELNSIIRRAMARFRDRSEWKEELKRGTVTGMEMARPTFRYEKASDLAREIKMFLDGEKLPPETHKYTSLELARRAFKKNSRKLVWGAGSAFIVLAAIVFFLLYRNAEAAKLLKAEKTAREASQQAQSEAERAQQEAERREQLEKRQREAADRRGRATVHYQHAANLMYRNQSAEEALQEICRALDRATTEDDTFYDAYLLRGLVNYRLGRATEALADLQKAFTLAKEAKVALPEALIYQADVYSFLLNDKEKALDCCRQAAGTGETDNEYVLTAQAYILCSEKKIPEALEKAEAARRKASYMWEPYFVLAYCNSFRIVQPDGSLDQAELQKTLDLYNTAIQNSDDKAAVAYSNRASLLLEAKNDVDGALSDINRSLKLMPNQINAINVRANIMVSLKRFDEALKDFDLLIGLQPNFAAAYAGRGNAYMQTNQYAKAETDLSRGMELGSEIAIMNMAVLRKVQGRYDEAVQLLERGRKLSPRHSSWVDGQLQEIERLRKR